MKINNKLICQLLALIMMFCTLTLPIKAETETYTLDPIFSDGISLIDGQMQVEAQLEHGVLTFRENKVLTFTINLEQGWSFNEQYSVFFPNNADRTSINYNTDGSITFRFNALYGESVALEDFLGIGIYASAQELPKLEINIDIPFSSVTKDAWVDAEFNLTLGTKQFTSGNYSGTGSIKGRGNTSWGQPKKPYSIKLSSKQSLLDIPKTKKYAIVPGYADESLMRNLVTYKIAALLSGIEYTPKCEFVEVYLNGAYNGIYTLVERVGFESNKLDYDEADENDLTGAYLIEKDIDGKIDFSEDQWFNCPYWANQSRDFFVLKDPEPEDSALLDQMLDYLEQHMQKLHDSIMGTSDESYTQYVDEESWMDYIIIQELTKNIDGNLKTSCYMLKKSEDDHIYMTAPWDFDLAYGNANWDNADYQHNDYYDCPSGTGTTGFMVINSSCPWFDHLYDDYPEFRNALIERYNSYRNTLIVQMRSLMNEQAAYLSQNTDRNDSRWGTDFSGGVDTLMNWFDGRINWLDRQWLEDYESIDLDTAMNISGGTLHFSTESQQYPFIGASVGGRLVGSSDIAGIDSASSGVSLNLNMTSGETLSFEYLVSSEQNYDKFIFKVNGTTLLQESGESGWTQYTFTASNSGNYSFEWIYSKDYSVSSGTDCVFIDNVSYLGSSDFELGDVNMDGTVNISDALLVVRYSMGIDSLSDEQLILADFNQNGSINMDDASLILRRAMSINTLNE